MTNIRKFIGKTCIISTAWLAFASAAYAECNNDQIVFDPTDEEEETDEGGDPTAPLRTGPGGLATDCFQAGRAAGILSLQPNILARRAAQPSGIAVTQGTEANPLDGYSGPLWVALSGRTSELDNGDLDMGSATIGSDIFLGDVNVVGVMFQSDFAYQDGPIDTSFDGTGYLIGLYGIHFGADLTVDARIMAGQSSNDVTGGGDRADDISGTRWMASTQVSSEAEIAGGTTFMPHFALGWFEETMEEYTLAGSTVTEETVSYGQADVGGTLRYPLTLGGADGSVTFAVGGIWGFGGASENAVPSDFRGRVDLGVELFRASSWAVSAKVFEDGLGIENYSAQGLDLGITLWF
ncbi:autotransporter outer membrane beta-barrel domain-containing protein [Yoonia sp. SS1-5]|uniref:Autotransporter outer membrane beta-barrel domain-containing protein n=1 Tax=Yoonia rhodophyticola TaxID=3137370 RepID=A0AAN0MAT6_9RHOB